MLIESKETEMKKSHENPRESFSASSPFSMTVRGNFLRKNLRNHRKVDRPPPLRDKNTHSTLIPLFVPRNSTRLPLGDKKQD